MTFEIDHPFTQKSNCPPLACNLQALSLLRNATFPHERGSLPLGAPTGGSHCVGENRLRKMKISVDAKNQFYQAVWITMSLTRITPGRWGQDSMHAIRSQPIRMKHNSIEILYALFFLVQFWPSLCHGTRRREHSVAWQREDHNYGVTDQRFKLVSYFLRGFLSTSEPTWSLWTITTSKPVV